MSIDQILDGAGLGYVAGVNAQQQLLERSAGVSLLHQATLLGDAYSWTAVSANINATDTGLLVANRSSTRWLVISRLYIRTDTEAQVKIHVPVPATWTGTLVLGNNLNRALPGTAPAVAYADETGNALVAGQVILTVYCPNLTNGQVTTALPQLVDLNDALILAYDDAIAVDLVAETGAFEITIVGYFIDQPA